MPHLVRIVTLWIMFAVACAASPVRAAEPVPAKELFGNIRLPSKGRAQPVGFYAKGCMAGGIAIAMDGPNWQTLHPSRNRRWGHPRMIALLEQLSREAAAKDGWPGLLIGDISQPRGGPMLSGHSSHQIGLDADIWLTPMPKRTLSVEERETIPRASVLRDNTLRVDPSKWSPAHAALIMRAASYADVERIFVHPGIKKKLCDSWKGSRANLGKVRPYYGHHYHFHIRMRCPPDAANCEAQAPVGYGDGCGKELAWWLSDKPWGKPAPKTAAKPKAPVKQAKPKFTKLSDLPDACTVVLRAPAVPSEMQATMGTALTASAETVAAVRSAVPVGAGDPAYALPDIGPVPATRPLR